MTTPNLHLPFNKGSATSQSAAESHTKEGLSRDEKLVFEKVEEAGKEGLTDDQIEQMTGLMHQTASARRRGLVVKGRVRDSGQVRSTRSGRNASVWVVGRQEIVAGKSQSRGSRPPNKLLQMGGMEIIRLLNKADGQAVSAGYATREEMEEIARWITHISKDA